MPQRISVMTVRLMGEQLLESETVPEWDAKNRSARDFFQARLSEAVDAINSQLDEGYYVKLED